jgi:putative heme-binding domain-containing protein
LGLDGWVYVANGLRGGRVVRPDGGEPINISGLDFRFDPVGKDYEAISGPGQFGNAFDDWGNRFVCDNRHHLRHVVLDNRYVRRNPYLAVPALVEDISELEDGPLGSGGKVYPISKNWTTSSLHEGRFTAACGVHIYRGSLLPKEFQGAAFTCEPTGNLVHMEVLTAHDATFKAKPARSGVEFLATPDDWFRPVSMASGPDGALYIVDMYRAVIEHPEFMPPELQARPDLTLGKDKGRIWRIVPEGYQAKPVRPNLSKASSSARIAALEHPDSWWRTTAARLLFQRKDAKAAEPLRKVLLAKEKDPRARIQAAWLLAALNTPNWDDLLVMLSDPDPKVRSHGVLLAERNAPSTTVAKRLQELAADPDAQVRYQVALSLGNWTAEKNYPYLAKIALTGAGDKWTRLAVASSSAECAGKVVEALVASEREFMGLARAQQAALLHEFTGLVGSRQDAGEIAETLTAVSLFKGTGAFQAVHLPAMTGLAEGLARRGRRLPEVIAKLPPGPNPALVQWLDELAKSTVALAAKPAEAPEPRVEATRYLAHLALPSVQPTLTSLMETDPSQQIRIAAVRALAAHPERQVASLLLKSWRSHTPAVRREILEALCRDSLRINSLFDEIEARRVRPGDVDPARARQLLAHSNPGIRERAQKLLRDSLPADRKTVLDQYQLALALGGDASRGKEVFKKNCATCHKVAGIGIDIGPDISDTRTKTESALLVDILNPNQAIDNNYINYVVTTKGGRTLTGLLAAETASSLTLKRAEGQSDVVLRQDVESIESTGLSLMPEGLEKNIAVEEMADLLRFLKNWRYMDGSVPVRAP